MRVCTRSRSAAFSSGTHSASLAARHPSDAPFKSYDYRSEPSTYTTASSAIKKHPPITRHPPFCPRHARTDYTEASDVHSADGQIDTHPRIRSTRRPRWRLGPCGTRNAPGHTPISYPRRHPFQQRPGLILCHDQSQIRHHIGQSPGYPTLRNA